MCGEPVYSISTLKKSGSSNASYVANKLYFVGEKEKWSPKRQKKLAAAAPRIPDSRSSSSTTMDSNDSKSASEPT